MDPSLILGAGSAIMGALESQRAQKQAQRIAEMNYSQQQAASNRQNTIAQQALEMQRAASTDAEGNTQQYIPGVGWVATATPQRKATMDASNAEEFARLTHDAQLGRQNLNDDFARRGREGGMADQTMNEWQQNDVPDMNSLRQALYAQKTAGIDRGFDDESRMAMRQANRSGASNAGDIVGALAARRAEAHGDARNSSYLDALTTRDSLQTSRDSRLGNKYNLLAGRATGSQPGFMPNGTNSELRSAMQARQATAPQAFGVAGNLAGNAPQFDTSVAKPNFGNALALGGLADIVSTMKFDGGGSSGGGFQSGSKNSSLMKTAGTNIRNQSRASGF